MSKYHNQRVRRVGYTFDSLAEARRYDELRLLQHAGAIHDISVHPRFTLDVAGVHICDYVGDFQYRDCATGKLVIEDVKGVRTQVYRMKRRLMLAVHGIEVVEVEV